MTDPTAPPRDDAELAARIEAATRPPPWAPHDRARFAARVREKALPAARPRWLRPALVGVALAAGFALVASLQRETPRAQIAAPITPQLDSAFSESWEEQLLYSPEWIEGDDGFVDSEVLPDSYALASELLDS